MGQEINTAAVDAFGFQNEKKQPLKTVNSRTPSKRKKLGCAICFPRLLAPVLTCKGESTSNYIGEYRLLRAEPGTTVKKGIETRERASSNKLREAWEHWEEIISETTL